MTAEDQPCYKPTSVCLLIIGGYGMTQAAALRAMPSARQASASGSLHGENESTSSLHVQLLGCNAGCSMKLTAGFTLPVLSDQHAEVRQCTWERNVAQGSIRLSRHL